MGYGRMVHADGLQESAARLGWADRQTDRHTQTVAAAGRRPLVGLGRSAGRPEVTKGFEAVGRSVRGWCSSGHGLGGGGGGGAGVCLSIDGVDVILRAEVGEGGQSSHVFSGEGQATDDRWRCGGSLFEWGGPATPVL